MQVAPPPTAADLGANLMTQGNERFLRENRDVGQMVGGDVSGVGNLREGTGQTGQAGRAGQNTRRTSSMFNQFGGFNQYGGYNQLGGLYGAGMYNSLNRQRQSLRMPVQLGFSTPAVHTPAVVADRVQTRLDRIPRIREMGSVTVEMEGQTAVLRGQVATAADRELVAKMLLLEPGISDVRNELTSAPPADNPPALP